MNTILLGMIKSFLPSEGKYLIEFATHSDDQGKSINLRIGDPETKLLVANIDLYFPKNS